MNQLTIKNEIPNMPNAVCSKCGSDVFEQIYIIKIASILQSGTGKKENLPIPGFRCADCKNINEEFIPKILRAKKENI